MSLQQTQADWSQLDAARCAVADIFSLQHDRGLDASEIDWDQLLTISYRHYVRRGGVIVHVGEHMGANRRARQRFLQPEQLIEVAADQLDERKLPEGISFIRIVATNGVLDVLQSARHRILNDRPVVSITFDPTHSAPHGPEIDALLDVLDEMDLSILDLLGNELARAEFSEVAGTYYRDYLLVPRERLKPMATARSAVRGKAFRAIDTHNPTIARWKKRFGL